MKILIEQDIVNMMFYYKYSQEIVDSIRKKLYEQIA